MDRMIALKHESNPVGNPVKVLHLEDSDADHLLVKRAIAKNAIVATITRVEDWDSLNMALRAQEFDIVLMDYRLQGFTALEAWDAISKLPVPPPCVILSGAIGEAAAVAAIQTGVTDYLHKDKLDEIGRVMLRAMKAHQLAIDRQRAAKALEASEQRITELARHLQTSLEEERASIAREIHDDIGGSLAAIRLDVAWIKRHSQDHGILARLDSVQEVVGKALASTQRIMRNTRPEILDQGLSASVQWLIDAHSKRVGRQVTAHCNLENDRGLADAYRLTAYRTVQESLTNISKYAPDADVSVDLSDSGDVLTVEVTDNGPGFNVGQTRSSSGFGLKGLSERAKNIGGWLDVSSVPGKGTSITLTVPLPARTTNSQVSETGEP